MAVCLFVGEFALLANKLALELFKRIVWPAHQSIPAASSLDQNQPPSLK